MLLVIKRQGPWKFSFTDDFYSLKSVQIYSLFPLFFSSTNDLVFGPLLRLGHSEVLVNPFPNSVSTSSTPHSTRSLRLVYTVVFFLSTLISFLQNVFKYSIYILKQFTQITYHQFRPINSTGIGFVLYKKIDTSGIRRQFVT